MQNQKSARILVRMFNHRQMVLSDTSRIPMSSYLPYPLLKALKRALENSEGMRESDWIVGPVYNNGKDFQFGVTGGVHHNEPDEMAITRELGEEIGLVPVHLTKLFKLATGTRKGRKLTFYECHIGDMIKVLDHQHGITISHGNDDRNRKVGCFVYGTKREIAEYMSNPIYVYDSEDAIDGVAAIKISEALKLIAANNKRRK